MTPRCEGGGVSAVPEVGHAVEGGLLVEDVPLLVHYNRTVHVVLDPVWSSGGVQGQVPVRPAHNVMVQVLDRVNLVSNSNSSLS